MDGLLLMDGHVVDGMTLAAGGGGGQKKKVTIVRCCRVTERRNSAKCGLPRMGIEEACHLEQASDWGIKRVQRQARLGRSVESFFIILGIVIAFLIWANS